MKPITVEDLAKLSLQGIVAFAARCAMRVCEGNDLIQQQAIEMAREVSLSSIDRTGDAGASREVVVRAARVAAEEAEHCLAASAAKLRIAANLAKAHRNAARHRFQKFRSAHREAHRVAVAARAAAYVAEAASMTASFRSALSGFHQANSMQPNADYFTDDFVGAYRYGVAKSAIGAARAVRIVYKGVSRPAAIADIEWLKVAGSEVTRAFYDRNLWDGSTMQESVLDHGDSPALPAMEVYIDRGNATKQDVAAFLRALNRLNMELGGEGYDFTTDGKAVQRKMIEVRK